MLSRDFPFARFLSSILFGCFVLGCAARAQQVSTVPPPTASQDEDVVRVNTELVQTDVMVFDKQGRFIDGLRPENFELLIDGKPQAISFFERIVAGSVDEDAQLAAARGLGGAATARGIGGAEKTSAGARPLDRGRVVIFFVDDLHLSPGSVKRTRDMLLRFIDEQMGQNDSAVVASASGRLGFLQQLTSEKAVLRKAVNLLNYHPYDVRGAERPPMSEAQAIAIERRDFQVMDYFVEQALKEMPMMQRESIENMLTSRAHGIIQQASSVSVNLLASFEHLMRSAAEMPGRKVVFFISDGFLLSSRDTTVRDRMRRLTDATARAGGVIYSMDARGLESGLPDASSDEPFDPKARLLSTTMSERSSLQEPLFTLAADTGGRALINTNALDTSLAKTLKETSLYYLLAWRPEQGEQRTPRFRRIEVRVRGRSDLNVMVRRGVYDAPPPPLEAKRGKEKEREKEARTPEKISETELLSAIRSAFPKAALPIALSLGYVNAPKLNTVLNISLEVDDTVLDYKAEAGTQNARADVLGAILNADGKLVSSFKQQLSVLPPRAGASEDDRHILYTQTMPLPPGLYQVRAAARDLKSGRTGSAAQWIEIPNVSQGQLTLSSIFIGERASNQNDDDGNTAESPNPVVVSVDRRFARNSHLRFLLHIYNAARNAAVADQAAAPDVALQIQVFRDDQPVITTPLSKVRSESLPDIEGIPYAAEISLNKLPAGRYVLQITAIDRVAKSSAKQHINFTVE